MKVGINKKERQKKICLYCNNEFIHENLKSKGMYCGKSCSSQANGKRALKHKIISRGKEFNHLDFTSHEEHQFYYEDLYSLEQMLQVRRF